MLPWLSLDSHLGCLSLHLDSASCFSAEIYASEDLHVPNATDELKVRRGAALGGAVQHSTARYGVAWRGVAWQNVTGVLPCALLPGGGRVCMGGVEGPSVRSTFNPLTAARLARRCFARCSLTWWLSFTAPL